MPSPYLSITITLYTLPSPSFWRSPRHCSRCIRLGIPFIFMYFLAHISTRPLELAFWIADIIGLFIDFEDRQLLQQIGKWVCKRPSVHFGDKHDQTIFENIDPPPIIIGIVRRMRRRKAWAETFGINNMSRELVGAISSRTPMTPSIELSLFTTTTLFGCILSLVCLPWQINSMNIGFVLLCSWLLVGCSMLFANSLVMNTTIWCDICE